jgi:hypothetical protein
LSSAENKSDVENVPTEENKETVAGDVAPTMVNGSHPVMAGVTSLQDSSPYLLNVGLRTGATSLAIWNTNPAYQCIAVSGDSQVVGLNMALFDGSSVTGNISTLLHNAVTWLAGI